MLGNYGSVKILSRVKVLLLTEDAVQFVEENTSKYPRSKDRLECFLLGNFKCVSCNLPANFFAIEEIASKSFNGLTINMYGVNNNKEILFTKDHIIPKSLGGADSQENYQTMCWNCNQQKGNSMP